MAAVKSQIDMKMLKISISNKKRILFFIILALFLLLLFLSMELTLRHFFPHLKQYINIPYDNKKNIGYTGGFPFSYNKWHMREINFSIENSHNQLRILCLGDSITFGFGLPYEAVWPKKLQGNLSKKYVSHRIFCINSGGVGLNSHRQLEIYKTIGRKLNPKIVIVGFCLNDVEPNDYKRARLVSEGYKLRELMKFRFYLRTSFLFTATDIMFTNCYRKYIWPIFSGKNPLFIREYSLNCFGITPFSTKAWRDTLKSLKDLKIICDLDKVKLIIATFPYRFLLSDDTRDNPYAIDKNIIKINPFLKIHKFCLENDIFFINLSNKFIQVRYAMLNGQIEYDPLFFDYCHPNAKGHKLASQVIAEEVERLNLIRRNLNYDSTKY